MEAFVNDILPFNETDTHEVIHEINMIVRSNAIGIPVLAIIQGGVAMIGYLLFGARRPIPRDDFMKFLLSII